MNKSTPPVVISLGVMACLGTLLCWTSAPLFIEYLTDYLDLWTQNLLRYGAACLFWLPVLIIAAKEKKLPKTVWKRAILPALPNIFMQTMWAAAFYYIDPGFVSLLSTTAFLWVIILSFIFFIDERHHLSNRMFWLSICTTITGLMGVMLFHPASAHSYTLIGTTIILVYGLIWGFYALSVKVMFRGIDSRIGFSVVSIYTIVPLVILSFIFGQPQKSFDMPAWGWAAAIFSGITGIALGHVLYYISIHRLGATTPSLILLTQPFVVVVISFFIFDEKMTFLQIISGIILISGAAMAILAKKESRISPQNISPIT